MRMDSCYKGFDLPGLGELCSRKCVLSISVMALMWKLFLVFGKNSKEGLPQILQSFSSADESCCTGTKLNERAFPQLLVKALLPFL